MRRRSILESCSESYPKPTVDEYANSDSVELIAAVIHSGDMMVARVNEEVVGYVWVCSARACLCELIVAAKFQRKGIGSQLLETGLSMIGSASDNPVTIYATYNARGFYGKLGFKEMAYLPAENKEAMGLPLIKMTRPVSCREDSRKQKGAIVLD